MNTQETATAPTRHDGITLTGHQLLQALEFTSPDRETDPQQLETEVCIEWMPERTAHDGSPMPAGDFIYLVEYPEEGVMQLEAEPPESSSVPATFDLIAHLRRQQAFSERTFGPGDRLLGITAHIAQELKEVRDSGGALAEWVDVILLALDGAWRSGATPERITAAIRAKQTKNEGHTWPDWRTAPADRAIEHDRSKEGTPTGLPRG